MAGRGLFGREDELNLIRDGFLRALDGAAVSCFITAEVGIGKTALLDAATAQARDLGFAVAAGRADELSRYTPFGVLVAALDIHALAPDDGTRALHHVLARSTAGDDTNDIASEWRFRVLEGFAELVEQRADARPLLLSLDDLPQADTASVTALELILDRALVRPFVLLTTLRAPVQERSVEALVERLERRPGSLRLQLGPLEEPAVLQLARHLLDAEPGSSLRERLAGAGGNPLLISEFIRAAELEGLIQRADGAADVLDPCPPEAARSVIVRRLRFLPEPVMQTVRVAAVAAHPVLPDILAGVQERPVSEVLAECRVATEAGILAEAAEGKVSFRHDLLREVIYEDLAESARRALHRQVARELMATGEEPVLVSHHLRRGAHRGDRDAIDWLRKSAAAQSRRDPAVAADLLRHALQLAELPAGEEAELRADLASLLVWNDAEQAEVEARAALALATSPTIRARAREVRIRALTQAARWPELLREVAAFADDPTTPRRQRLRAVADTVIIRGWAGDIDGAHRQGQEALAAAVADGDDAAAVSAQAGMAGLLVAQGQLQEALHAGRAALERTHRSTDDDARRRHVQVPLALILQECDRFDEEAEVIADGRCVGAHLGTWQLPLYHFEEASRLFLSGGDWGDVTAEIETGFALAGQTGTTLANPWAHACLALIAAHRGEPAAAAHADAGEKAFAAGGGGYGVEWVVLARSRVLQLAGDHDAALAALSGFWDLGEAMGLVFHRRVLGPGLTRMATDAGQTDRARAVAAAMVELADTNDVAGLRCTARLCVGMAESDPAVVAEAAALADDDARPLERAEVLEAAGAVLRPTDPASAAGVLSRAAELYASLGATASSERCEALLCELDRPSPRRGTARPTEGWASLTPREVRVSALVAEGLTNGEIARQLHISRHTVETHVKHIYAKLSIRSRVDLTLLVHHHGAP